ncbi:MAG TPA: sulfatase [bacterium]|nr:sulfatase [bacterium]
MTKRQTLIVVITGCVVVAALAGLLLPKLLKSKARSIILISVDTLRPDHLGCYGYAKNTSPAIDAFARDATLFERCFSQAPNTRPSCASFLSGFYPHECKVASNSDNLPPEVTTLAERLKAKGYRTLAASSNFVLGPGSGFDQGFDVFDNQLDELETVRQVPERVAAKTTDAAIRMLDSAGGKFFLWVHFQDPHGPYTPPAPYDSMFLDPNRPIIKLPINPSLSGIGGIPIYQKLGNHDDYWFYVAQYDGEIGYLDKHLGRLLQALKDRGLYDKSLIILTADHGEGMGERGYYFAHGEFVFNNLERVPLVIRPGGQAPSRRTEYAQLLDLAPTILRYAGLGPDPKLRGRDLFAASLSPTPILCEMDGKYSMIEDGIKVVVHVDDREFFLFDLKSDLNEEHNLIQDQAYVQYVEPLLDRIDSLMAEDRIQGAVETPANLSPQDKERMKSLGYTH